MSASLIVRTAKRSRVARVAVVLFVVFSLVGLGATLTSASPPFTISIDSPVGVSDHTVTLSGTANSPSNADHHVEIAWGDGNTDVLPDFTTDAPWTWGSLQHTYAADGTYTIVATLIHATNSGNDLGTATDSAEASLPGPCTEDCPTDGNTDDGTTDGTVQPPVQPPTQVAGRTVTRRPLPRTGSETTALAWVGMLLLVSGAAMRFVKMPARDAAFATTAPSTQDMIRRALERGSRNWKCNG